MRKGSQNHVAYPSDQCTERRIAPNIRAQGQQIDKTAQHPFKARCQRAMVTAAPVWWGVGPFIGGEVQGCLSCVAAGLGRQQRTVQPA